MAHIMYKTRPYLINYTHNKELLSRLVMTQNPEQLRRLAIHSWFWLLFAGFPCQSFRLLGNGILNVSVIE